MSVLPAVTITGASAPLPTLDTSGSSTHLSGSNNKCQHYFIAQSDQSVVSHKPVELHVTLRTAIGEFEVYQVSLKISEKPLHRRTNLYVPHDCLAFAMEVPDDGFTNIMQNPTVQQADSSICIDTHTEAKVQRPGFIFYVQTEGGKTDGRPKQVYMLLKRHSQYRITTPRKTEIVNVCIKSAKYGVTNLPHWNVSLGPELKTENYLNHVYMSASAPPPQTVHMAVAHSAPDSNADAYSTSNAKKQKQLAAQLQKNSSSSASAKTEVTPASAVFPDAAVEVPSAMTMVLSSTPPQNHQHLIRPLGNGDSSPFQQHLEQQEFSALAHPHLKTHMSGELSLSQLSHLTLEDSPVHDHDSMLNISDHHKRVSSLFDAALTLGNEERSKRNSANANSPLAMVVDSDEEDASTYMNTGSSIGWKHYLQQEDRDISQRKKMRFTPELKGQNLASDVHIRHNPYPVDTEQENTRCFSAWQNGPFALCFPDDQVPETPVAEVTSKDGDGVLRNYAIDADDVAGGGIRLSKSETSTLLFPGQNTKSNSNKTETTETWFQPPWWCQ